MPAPATKLPAAPAASRAPAPVAVKAEAPVTSSGSGAFKALVWFLVLANLAAIGGWVWFKYMKNKEADKAMTTSRKRLIGLQTSLDLLQATVRGIAASGVNEVKDPGVLIVDVAKQMGIQDHVTTGAKNSANFHRTNYSETTVKITFLNKRVYEFADVVRFLTHLEAANPTVQIKDVDFGKRTPPTIGSDAWIPNNATVRTLQLKSAPGS